MVGLDRQDGGCRFDEFLALEQGCRAGIGGHADILKQHTAEQEVHVAGKRVEIRHVERLGDSLEAGFEVDGWPGNSLAA
jgi:hypothetical protein